MKRALAALPIAVLALASAGRAWAQPPPKSSPAAAANADGKRRIVGILDVRVEGVAPEIGAQFQRDLEAQLDSKRYWLAPRTRVHDLMARSTKWTEGCVIGKCLMDVHTQTGADVVLLAALDGSGTSYGYVVTAVRTDTGAVLSQMSARCDVCTVNEALTAATKAAVKIIHEVPDELPAVDSIVAAAPVALPEAPRPIEAPPINNRHHAKLLGTVLAITGAVVGGAGAAIYEAKYHMSGVGAAAAGGGLLVGGAVVLAF